MCVYISMYIHIHMYTYILYIDMYIYTWCSRTCLLALVYRYQFCTQTNQTLTHTHRYTMHMQMHALVHLHMQVGTVAYIANSTFCIHYIVYSHKEISRYMCIHTYASEYVPVQVLSLSPSHTHAQYLLCIQYVGAHFNEHHLWRQVQ